MPRLAVYFLAITLPPAGAADEPKEKPPTEAAVKALKVVADKLAELKAGLEPHALADPLVEREFPDLIFVAAHARQFPVARLLPEGMSLQNLFVVHKDGKLDHLTDAKQLEKFFHAALAPVKEDAAARGAARAWVRLSQEFHQDGFYKFVLADDSTKVVADGKGKKASARTVVMGGGNGELAVTLTFDEAGKLTEVAETAQIKAGARPVCQATKLLDADPIVRAMAERDLRIMGRAARPYLLEQRAKASPELREAIDRLWRRVVADDE